MEKLDLKTPNFTNKNIDKIAELFPNCVTEKKSESGELERAIDFDALRQELSDSIVEGSQERYNLNWPGKREALVKGNTPIFKTLRPCRDESVDFDNTKNIFIEGDNLDALKLLQETYLNKIKMIYIDPPYNTGNDFIYNDNFTADKDEYDEASGQRDEDGGRLVANPDSNGRYHSDWLSMIYPRLKLARNLLQDEGAIFISIDDNEQSNLRKLCNEIFGESSFVAAISCINKPSGRSDDKYVATAHEYILIYMKSSSFEIGEFDAEEHITRRYTKTDARGGMERKYRVEDLRKRGTNDERIDRPNLFYPFFYSEDTGEFFIGDNSDNTPAGYVRIEPMKSNLIQGNWRWGKETVREKIGYLHPKYMSNKRQWSVFQWEYLDERTGVKPTSHWNFKDVNSERGTGAFKDLGFSSKIFQNPKPIGTIERILKLGTTENDVILDFFAGSGTTAHAVMQFNAEDGGTRQCISVQLPEVTNENSEAFKAGYKNIAEISKERIRRAGKKIKEDSLKKDGADKEGIENLDTGFRVFKIDSTNMVDVHVSPDEANPELFDAHVGNIKNDRSSEDLLFQVLLDWGVDLSLPIIREEIVGKEVFFVDGNALVACFDDGIDEKFVTELATRKPLRVVFRDDGFGTGKDGDSVKINVEQVFKLKSPATDIKVI